MQQTCSQTNSCTQLIGLDLACLWAVAFGARSQLQHPLDSALIFPTLFQRCKIRTKSTMHYRIVKGLILFPYSIPNASPKRVKLTASIIYNLAPYGMFSKVQYRQSKDFYTFTILQINKKKRKEKKKE